MGASAGGGGFGGFGGGGGGSGVGGGGTGTFGGGRSGMFRATPAMGSPQPSGGPIGNILTSAMGGFRGMQPTSPFVDPYASRVPNFMTPSDTMSPQQYAWTQTPEGRAAGGQEQMNTNIQQNVRNLMGDYGGMINLANQNQTSEADIARALGVSQSNVYTAMNRPGYQQYGPSGQFYQPIYRQQYTNYSRSPTYYQPSYGMSLMSPEVMGYGFGSFNPFAYYAEGGEVAEDEGIAALRNA